MQNKISNDQNQTYNSQDQGNPMKLGNQDQQTIGKLSIQASEDYPLQE